jgi:hypothetical protein
MQRWKLRARLGVRGPEPNHKCVLEARWVHLVLPALSRRLLRHTLLQPTTPVTTSGLPGLRLGGDRSSVVFLLYKQRPDDSRHLVGERDSHQHTRFASQTESRKPAISGPFSYPKGLILLL